jgi:hypothetical protein
MSFPAKGKGFSILFYFLWVDIHKAKVGDGNGDFTTNKWGFDGQVARSGVCWWMEYVLFEMSRFFPLHGITILQNNYGKSPFYSWVLFLWPFGC